MALEITRELQMKAAKAGLQTIMVTLDTEKGDVEIHKIAECVISILNHLSRYAEVDQTVIMIMAADTIRQEEDHNFFTLLQTTGCVMSTDRVITQELQMKAIHAGFKTIKTILNTEKEEAPLYKITECVLIILVHICKYGNADRNTIMKVVGETINGGGKLVRFETI